MNSPSLSTPKEVTLKLSDPTGVNLNLGSGTRYNSAPPEGRTRFSRVTCMTLPLTVARKPSWLGQRTS